MRVWIAVQTDPIDCGALESLVGGVSAGVGAVVSFSGLVRDFNEQGDIVGLELEHYPGMTEAALQQIAQEAGERWPLLGVSVTHRVGNIYNGEVIVHVSVASQHRMSAFEACEFIMDFLKTRAPFWKKELTERGGSWVEAKSSDETAADRWR